MTDTQTPNYPECERLSNAMESGKAQEFQDVIGWIMDQGYVISEWDEETWTEPRLQQVTLDSEALLHKFLDIDPKKLDIERRQMLINIKAANEGATTAEEPAQ